MRLLYLSNSNVYNADVTKVIKKRNHEIHIITIPDTNIELSQCLLADKEHAIFKIMGEQSLDAVISLCFYPCISALCEYYRITYVSWIITQPYSDLFFSNILGEHNLVFAADRQIVNELQKEGIRNIHYLPQGINAERFEEIINDGNVEKDCRKISFCGNIKNKSWEEYFGAKTLSNSTKGYLDGMIACQSHVYGLDFFSKPLPDYVLKDIAENSSVAPVSGSVETLEHFYRENCFYPKMTITERLIAIDALSKIGEIYLYSDDTAFQKEGIINCGDIHSENILEIIKKTKVNINITPRGYRDGLYGNVLQVMGMGGFLISDYRPELEEEFIPGEEIIVYENMADLLNKVIYYTEHEEERKEIAQRGQKKVREKHTLEQRIEVIEKYIQQKITNGGIYEKQKSTISA